MKANEFFKLHDLDFIKHLIAQNSNLTADYFDTCALYSFNGTPVVDGIDVPRKPFFDDLKRLVDSWELVNEFDDIEQAKAWIPAMDKEMPYNISGSKRRFMRDELIQAIADVESCQ